MVLPDKLKAALRHPVGLPAIAAAERVWPLQSFVGLQSVRHHGGHRGRQAHLVLLEQDSGFTRDEGRVELGRGKRIAAHHMAQKLHIGVQAHDVGLGQRRVQLRRGK